MARGTRRWSWGEIGGKQNRTGGIWIVGGNDSETREIIRGHNGIGKTSENIHGLGGLWPSTEVGTSLSKFIVHS